MPPATAQTIGIVLFAHGSRDPQWRKPVEAVARRIQQLQPDTLALCAYLELCTPNLATAVHELITSGVTHISIVPMFLGMGQHARQDLPQLVAALRQHYPGTTFALQAAMGERTAILDLMAQLALDDARSPQPSPTKS